MATWAGLLLRVRTRRTANRILTALLSTLITLQPLLPTINAAFAADMIEYGRQQGSDVWNQIQNGMIYPDTTGGTKFNHGGESISVNELFQAPNQNTGLQDYYGLSDSEFVEKGMDGRRYLIDQEKSAEGQAYRTLRESAAISRPNLQNDPIWGSTDAVYDFLAGKPVDCTEPDNHTPDYQTCERVNLDLQSCKVNHDYDVGIFKHISGPANMASCGEGCMDFWLGRIGDNYYSGSCKIFQEDMSIQMINPAAILDAKIVYAKWDDYMQIWVAEDKVWAGPNNNFPPETAGSCELGTSWEKSPNADVTKSFRDREPGEVVNLKVRVSVTGGGEGYAKVRVYYDPRKVVSNDYWTPNSCTDKARIWQAKYGQTGATCTRMPALGANGCINKNGIQACSNAFETPPIEGISPFCQEVSVSIPEKISAANTCKALEDNPTCGFITSSCDGKTPIEVITDMFKVGLGNQHPDPTAVNWWLSRFNELGGDWEKLRLEFFTKAGINNEDVINQFTCSTFVETYDCGYTNSANAGACAVQDLFKTDFVDCVEELVPQTVTRTVELRKTETCTDALKLTQCQVERDMAPVSRSSDTTYIRECFISEEVSYRLPWADSAASGQVTISTTGEHTSAEVIQQPSPSNRWTAKLMLNGSGQVVTKTRQIGRACQPGENAPCYQDEQYQVTECPVGSSLRVSLKATGLSVNVNDKETAAEIGNAPCLRESDEWTNTTWTCNQQSPLSFNGIPLTMEGLAAAVKPLYPGAPPTCIKATANYQTKEYGQGTFCWKNLEGEQECTTIDSSNGVSAGQNTCAPLEARKDAGECRYDGRFPVQGGGGETGFQYVYEHRYSCVTESKEVTKTEVSPKYVCSGIVKCMGDECMTPNRQSSDDFGKAAAMLQAVEGMGKDITCEGDNSMMNCQVFAGEAQICKQALGAYVDCCESPGGTTIMDYIKATKGMYDLDNYVMNTDGLEAVQGAYSTIRDPVVQPIQNVYSAFTEQLGNLTGGTSSSVGGAVDAAQTVMKGFQQQMMKGAQQVVTKVFNEQVAGMFFETGANGVVGLAGPFAAMLSVIGILYTIYQIAKILVNIIWKCEEEELGLAVDNDLKKTHYVGSYCAKKSIFGCTEVHQSYCVFSSPLARIINEQARPQLGRGWGTPQTPDCSGITLAELERLDWSQIDLGEWMDILMISDSMPGMQDLDIEALTGRGSYLGQLEAENGGDRKNTADRNKERLEGADLDKIRQDAGEDLWRGI